MFINFTNHPSEHWQDKQIAAAHEYGEIVDIPFPQIDPYADENEVKALVSKYYKIILEMKPSAILVAGEFTFSYQMINALLSANINVLVSCTVRVAQEKKLHDGKISKQSSFDFVAFRKYQNYISD